jgi:hypothetical protein
MARLSIPQEYHAGFAGLRNLDSSRAQELVSALREVQPVRKRSALYAHVAANVESIGRSELDEIMDTLVSLFTLRDDLGIDTPEFVSTVSEAMDQSGFDGVSFPDQESRESFEAVLAQILEIDSLGLAAKALSLVYEQDHIVHGVPRVLTDVRPIFSSDPADPSIRGAMVIHTLKLEYHDGRTVNELFAALNAEQVDDLIKVLKRAKSKAESLEQWLQESPISYVEPE